MCSSRVSMNVVDAVSCSSGQVHISTGPGTKSRDRIGCNLGSIKLGNASSKGFFTGVCCATIQLWWHAKFAQAEKLIHRHHWKVLSSSLLLGLLCLGLKLVTVDTDFDKLWVESGGRLVSEWQYVADALHRVSSHAISADQLHYYHGSEMRRPHMVRTVMDRSHPNLALDDSRTSSGSMHNSASFSSGLPGQEFMGTVETIMQESVQSTDNHPSSSSSASTTTATNSEVTGASILTPSALLDHVDLLIKVRRLQVIVGSSKWSFKDLCQRATLPFAAEMHPIQAYLDMIIPCLIMTPLDCFWEGSKVLGPEEAIWVPWFNERTLIQWTNIDPVGLLEELRHRYGNYSITELTVLIQRFRAAGINHGYLNRTCLDPLDPACPTSAPNYHGQSPDVPGILSGGCPGFASNVLHWPEVLIVGGRMHAIPNSSISTKLHDPVRLIGARALQSLILLRSPRELYEAVRFSDPYKHESWTVADAQHVLDEWRRSLRRLVMEHNAGLQSDSIWNFYAFTDNSLRDLLRELTLRLGPVKVAGCVLLVFLYGLVCLLDWRDPIRSQCWLALCGFLVIVLASVAGLGICAALGLSFNVFTIQILPFLLLGLGADGVFTFTTCYQCCLSRHITSPTTSSWTRYLPTPWPSTSSLSTSSSASASSTYSETSSSSSSHPVLVLPEHGPSLLFGTVAIAGAFLCAAYIPIPLMRHFCLQAGILVLVQSVSLLLIFPSLLKLDGTRRAQRRLDVLCCLQQPVLHTDSQACRLQFRHISSTDTGRHACVESRCVTGKCRTCRSTTHSEISDTARPCTTKSNHGCPCPSIQVNVINHLAADLTDSMISSQTNCSLSNEQTTPSGRTVHTTVTVTELAEDVTPATSSGREVRKEIRRGKSRLNTSKCVRAGSPTVYNNLHKSAGNPTSYNNRFSMHDPSNRESTPEQQFGHSTSAGHPPIVRIARRLTMMLTAHWLVQLFTCFIYIGLFLAAGFVAARRLHLSLDWTSMIPTDTVEYGFVRSSEQNFGLHSFQIVTRGTDLPGSRVSTKPISVSRLSDSFNSTSIAIGWLSRQQASFATVGRGIDFPMQQRQLHQLYRRILRLSGVMLAGRRYWLEAMRDWLQDVQEAFDSDRHRGLISDNGHWSSNASELGVLGLRLIVQTDHGPELSRLITGRLVRNGIVDPPAFYALLRVWRSYDALNFSALACAIYPEPSALRLVRLGRSGRPTDLQSLPPAEPIEFVQTSFYATGVQGTRLQLKLIQDIRQLTESATTQGVPAFPIGAPFTFVEHYLYLARDTSIALAILLAILFVISLVLFSSPVTAILLVWFGAGGGLCAGLCGLAVLGLGLNPISAGLLLFSAGLGARTTVGFLGSWTIPHCTTPFQHRAHHVTGTKPTCRSFSSCHNRHKGEYWCAVGSHAFATTHSQPDRVSMPTVDSESLFAQVNAKGAVRHSRVTDGPFTHVGDTNDMLRCRVRHHLLSIASSQFAATLHTTVGLLLALALLVAARVQLIADHFFWLIVIVSVICFLNATCLIPTLCYIVHPIQQYFASPYIERRQPIHSLATDREGTVSCNKQQKQSSDFSCNSTDLVFNRSAGKRIRQQPLQSSASVLSSRSNSSFSPIRSSTDSPVSTAESSPSPCTPVVSVHSVVRQLRTVDVPLKPAPRTLDSGVLSDNLNTQLLNRSTRHRAFPLEYRQSPEAAAAAMVVAVAAAATSVHSRPASLSTISEEPSHSSSTVSLNRVISQNAIGGCSNPSSTAVADVDIDSTSIRSIGALPQNPSLELLQLLKILSLNNSTVALYRQLWDSLPSSSSPTQTTSHFAPSCSSRHSRTAVVTPEIGSSGPRVHRIDLSPPPSYSSIINQVLSLPQTAVPQPPASRILGSSFSTSQCSSSTQAVASGVTSHDSTMFSSVLPTNFPGTRHANINHEPHMSQSAVFPYNSEVLLNNEPHLQSTVPGADAICPPQRHRRRRLRSSKSAEPSNVHLPSCTPHRWTH